MYDANVGFARKARLGVIARSVKKLALSCSVAFLALSAGCFQSTDPARPCAAMELGEPEPATFTSRSLAPILALSASDPVVLHHVCTDPDDETSCTINRTELPGLQEGNAVMITGAGHYVIGIDKSRVQLRWYRFDHSGLAETQSQPIDDQNGVVRLVASMRGEDNDWVIVRDVNGRLARYAPKVGHALLASDVDDLHVAAVGEDHLLARRVLDGTREALYLVPVTPRARTDGARTRLLMEGRTLSRVALSPRDEFVVATSGTGSGAQTFVFDVRDGSIVDRFDGAAVSGRGALAEVPGLRPVSPDGTHLAYRTPSGAAALRDLLEQSSCLVRSSSAGNHDLAGFAADGRVFLESNEGPGRRRVLAFDPSTRHLSELAPAAERFTLAAVPAYTAHRESARVWAIGVRNGSYSALQEDADPQGLDLTDPVFMPRDDEAMWVANARHAQSNDGRSLRVTRVSPRLETQTRAYRFASTEDSEVTVETPEGPEKFRSRLPPGRRICLSTGTPGAWGYRCGEPGDTRFLGSTPAPSSERPGASSRSDPEIPNVNEPVSCDGGSLYNEGSTTSCNYKVDFDGTACCYPTDADACAALGCSSSCLVGEGRPSIVTCGSALPDPGFG